MRIVHAALTSLALFSPACGERADQHADAASSGAAAHDVAAPSASADALPDTALLKSPFDGAMNQEAPAVFKARFVTTKGELEIEVHRDWSPRGADRFYNLVKAGFFDGVVFYRAVKGFMVQFGIHGDPEVSKHWRSATIQDDPVIKNNRRSFVSYAMGGPQTRSTQFFINTVDNSKLLDSQGFSPFGQVIEGMDVVDAFYSAYGEDTTGKQSEIQRQGNAFLKQHYPELDSIVTARLVD